MLARVAPFGSHVCVGPGKVVFREGQAGREFFAIVGGEVDLVGSAGESHLSTGQFFGERSALDGCPRDATATSAGVADLLVLSPANLQSLLEADEQIAGVILGRHADGSTQPALAALSTRLTRW